METITNNPNKYTNGKTIAGLIILSIGGILLINQLDLFFIPHWLFSWPMWIIAYGLYMGGKYNFKKPVWIWTIIIGSAFLLTENMPNTDRFIWPAAIIGLGAYIVMKHNRPTDAPYPGSNFNEL